MKMNERMVMQGGHTLRLIYTLHGARKLEGWVGWVGVGGKKTKCGNGRLDGGPMDPQSWFRHALQMLAQKVPGHLRTSSP
eukprot:jgi/Mesvir1/23896/Mv25235-RA.1